MVKVFSTILLNCLCTLVLSQTEISGRIIGQQNQVIPFANIFLKDTYDGATADENGNFNFHTSESGTHMLVVKALGYKDFEKTVTLAGSPLSFEINMDEQISELNAVVISAGSFTANDQGRRTVFRAIDIATTAGATADIAGALNTLPGTQKVGESGRLFVRGGDGNETRTFIDGLMVLDAYRPSASNTPSRGRFLPFMFKGTSFSTGGYSAEYGQALSSVLSLDSKDASEATRTDVGILSVGGDVAHTQAWEGGSVAGKLQYTNLKPYMNLVPQEIAWKSPPATVEGIAAFRQHVGKQGMVKVYGNFSDAAFAHYSYDIDDHTRKQLFDLNNKFRYMSGFYKNELSNNWGIRGGISYTFLLNEADIDSDRLRETENALHAKTVLEGSLSDNLEIKSGVEVISRNYDSHGGTQDVTAFTSSFNEVVSSLFAEADIFASNNFVTRLGVRVEHNNLLEKLSVVPRVALAYKAGINGQFSLAYGTFTQSPKNEFLRQNKNLGQERAEHFILNYQRIENNRTFRIETYYKRYDDLIKFADTGIDNTGSGYAKGIELFWRDNESVKRLDYWVSYSLLDTKRDYLNFPYKAIPSFASTHNFSAVAKYFFVDLKSQVGVTWSFASGRPYNNPNDNKFNKGKTPSYQDLSLNWSYLPTPYVIVHLSCTNILGRDNIFGYQYSTVLNESGTYSSRAIRQPAPRFLFLGVFITLSKDKSINQLPTL